MWVTVTVAVAHRNEPRLAVAVDSGGDTSSARWEQVEGALNDEGRALEGGEEEREGDEDASCAMGSACSSYSTSIDLWRRV